MSRVSNADVWPVHYRTGMWAWSVHRITGLIIALYGVAHIIVISFAWGGGRSFNSIMGLFQQPWILTLELLLIGVILYHTVNGLRILLFDLGIGIRAQKALFWGLLAVGLITLAVGFAALWPFIMGEPLS